MAESPRIVWRGGGLSLIGISAGVGSLGGPAYAADDLVTREYFDQIDAALNGGNGQKFDTNDKDSSGLSGKLAWGESYVLEGYALMYQATRDTYYLDKMVDHIDHVLANRDSERGVTDYAGASHPAWRADHHQTVGYGTIRDTDGTPVFEVRSALAYSDLTTITITRGSNPGEFRLEGYNSQYDRSTVHALLSTDPSSDRYAVDTVTAGFKTETPGRLLLTLRELRQDPGRVEVAETAEALVSRPYVFEVHTGQIVQPMLLFARLVRAEDRLQANPTYASRAELYLEAAANAVAVHDPEFRMDQEGRGYYMTQVDAPVWHAGMDNPINHFLALGRPIVQLAVLTGDANYADRATALARTLRDSMTTVGDAYVWPYWWQRGDAYNGWDIDAPRSQYRPWYPPNQVPEDTSHAQIDVNFAIEYVRGLRSFTPGARPPLGSDDLTRLAATYTDLVATTLPDGSAGAYRFVDGTGDPGLVAYVRQSVAWASLTPWNSQVLDRATAIVNGGTGLGGFGSALFCLAHAIEARHHRGGVR